MPSTREVVIDYDEVNYREETQKFFRDLPHFVKEYIIALLPIASWIHRYNLMWLVRDLIAGVTVGIVVVPQSMGYAKIAELPAEYGLYTAFVGLCVYCLFATSKDISIGPTAVMSLLVGQSVTHVTAQHPEITAQEIAVAFSLICGSIAMFIGVVRLGIIVDFIPGPAIAGFMTGSAITITIGQCPKLFGIPGINTQDSPYLIFGNFFKYLPDTRVDVAFGLVGLFFLYGTRFLCNYYSKKYPKYAMPLFFVSIMRNGVVVIFGTLIAFLINIGKETSPISILKTVPPGFQAMAVPSIGATTISSIAGSLPSGVIILILEHVAIAKSFGRINDYTINADQEIIAIGFTNIWAAFFGAYPSTGSFSRTAIKARSGVKTPIAGIFSGLVVVLALYALTPAFYYIPDAILAAVVIHAVADLVSGPSYVKRLAAVSWWELLVFVVAVVVTFFSTVDYGIYGSLGLSIVVLLFRIARPRLWALGRVPLTKTNDDDVAASSDEKTGANTTELDQQQQFQEFLYVPVNHPSLGRLVEKLPRGVLMFRIDESMTYPNSGFVADKIISYCKEQTRRGGKVLSKGERAWNDDANPKIEAARASLPKMHALLLDFSAVNRLDSSGLQAIVDMQNTLNRYAGHHVEFHFINLSNNPSIRRALIIAGFGTQPRVLLEDDEQSSSDASGSGSNHHSHHHHHQVSTGPVEVLPIVPNSKDGPHHQRQQALEASLRRQEDLESNYISQRSEVIDKKHHDDYEIEQVSIHLPKDKYPFFHWSADAAVRVAMHTYDTDRIDGHEDQNDDSSNDDQSRASVEKDNNDEEQQQPRH
ncbi:sulfate transporter family-domain-containing protein [Zychaea mexicana]|uniref:sulfate transporter family-domain-containing protein n=1 Tax=Zychaea mexicana TaxID=64656 RepID=UPI0022FF2D0C|nr:sulfate transporter family-domain-containing protein [Zychaea mexicana]KAI9490488.1 sulfate transporter family-domain-containing protein [Zychaea mexicana]